MKAITPYAIRGLDCANCAAKLEAALRRNEGLESASINFSTLTLHMDAAYQTRAMEIIAELEPEVTIHGTDAVGAHPPGSKAGKERTMTSFLPALLGALPLSWAILVLVAGIVFHDQWHDLAASGGWGPLVHLEWALVLSAYLPLAWPVLSSAFRKLRHGDFFDENFLMSIATLGAFAIHELPEALGVMVFYTIGEWFQDRAVAKSRASIRALVDIRPETARVIRQNQTALIDPALVEVGSLLEVRPGERIPLDGVVRSGSAWVDSSALTGEAVPRRAEEGVAVSAGFLVDEGVIVMQSTATLEDSASTRILRLVEEATTRKAPTERFITVFSRVYTPIMVFSALGLALIPPLLGLGSLADWTYRALVLLVISCPCALVISIPLGYFGGLGAASRAGILVKGSQYLDRLAALKSVVFDKTGTLTKGDFSVQDILSPGIGTHGMSADSVLALGAALEKHSSHPIGTSMIRAAAEKGLSLPELTAYREIKGKGVEAEGAEGLVRIGSEAFLAEAGARVPHHAGQLSGGAGTTVHLSSGGTWTGSIRIADQVRPEAGTTLDALARAGCTHTAVLSGDHPDNVERLARELRINEYKGGLLPGDKLAELETLLAEPGHRPLAFVGDGMNDAPVLRRADIGIAMGGLGSQAAIEAADVVLMNDSLEALPRGLAIARKTRRIVWQNIAFALAVKILFLVLGSFGLADLWEAVIADVGVALLAILNASRALRA